MVRGIDARRLRKLLVVMKIVKIGQVDDGKCELESSSRIGPEEV